jgi:hypothetical protein
MNVQRVALVMLLSVVGWCLPLAAETDYRFAFPQSEILLGVDVKWLMKSPVLAQAKGELSPLAGGALGELKPLEAMLDQLDTLYLSAVSKAPVMRNGKPVAGSSNSSDVLVLLTGRFEQAKLVEFALKNGFRSETWGKVKVLVPAAGKRNGAPARRGVRVEQAQFSMDSVKSSNPTVAFWDAKTLVIGEEGPLRASLERLESGLTPQANPLFERARNLEAAHDFWVVGNTAPLNVSGLAKGDDPVSKLVSQVRNFSVGVAARRAFVMELQLQTTTPKAATQMLDMVKGVVAMAKMNVKPGEELPVNLDEVLELSAAGNLMKASLHLEQAQMDQLVARMSPTGNSNAKEEKRSAPTPAPSAPVMAAKPVVAPKPVEPARKTVFIYGLPGGPKEVPVQP